jgi:acyl-CoA dehydrogenase
MPEERGGAGVGAVGMAACYEEMARSPFGPLVFNCAAPDDGNMMVLEKVLPEEQKDKWL